MRNVTQSVDLLVMQSPMLIESMSLGILNYSAVARRLLPDIRRLTGKKPTLAAVVMALRKLESSLADDSLPDADSRIPVRSIVVHSGLQHFVLKLSQDIPKLHAKLFLAAKKRPGQFFHAVYASDHVTLTTTPSLERMLRTAARKEVFVASQSCLSSLRVVFGGKSPNIGRMQHVLLQSLRWKGVEVFGVCSTSREVSYICQDCHADSALLAIQSVTRESSWGLW